VIREVGTTEPLSLDDAKRLLDLCERGRLKDIERWIASGQTIGVPVERRQPRLAVAARRCVEVDASERTSAGCRMRSA
jgi:hypothetical protein